LTSLAAKDGVTLDLVLDTATFLRETEAFSICAVSPLGAIEEELLVGVESVEYGADNGVLDIDLAWSAA
jgi:hypothetical protein